MISQDDNKRIALTGSQLRMDMAIDTTQKVVIKEDLNWESIPITKICSLGVELLKIHLQILEIKLLISNKIVTILGLIIQTSTKL